jgi:hypothetical protein
MYLQIIKVQGTNKIRLSNITLYDIYNQVIDIPKNAVTKQSSNYEENIGNSLMPKMILHNSISPLTGKTTMTSGLEDGWWEIDLLKLIEVGKIKISNTNVGSIQCMNSERQVLFKEIRDGFFSFEFFTDYTVHLPHTYNLSKKFTSDCIESSNKDSIVYTYQSCTSSNPNSCPPIYNNKLPKGITVDKSDPDTKYGIIDQKTCKTIGNQNLVNSSEWSECNGTQKIRDWEVCPKFKDCPEKPVKFTETQDCKNGELVWSAWSTCGDNQKKNRIATCIAPVNGGKKCPNVPYTQTEDCTNVKLSEWSNWSNCESGKVTKTRTCQDGTNGGLLCKDLDPKLMPIKITQHCSDAKFTEWSKWSACEDGTQKRNRECIQPVNGGKECPNEEIEQTQKCTNGTLTEWSEWSKCNGVESYRTRDCIKPTGNGKECQGTQRETVECKNSWSECTMGFEQFNESGEPRKCTPVFNLTLSFLMFIVLLIVLFLFYKYK